jgi:hypothetical protein
MWLGEWVVEKAKEWIGNLVMGWQKLSNLFQQEDRLSHKCAIIGSRIETGWLGCDSVLVLRQQNAHF